MSDQPILSVSTSKGAGDKQYLGQLPGASLALSIAELANAHHNHTVLIVPDPQTALRLHHEIEQFYAQSVTIFPDWETLPYDNFSPHQEIISDRIATLYQLPSQTDGITIVPVSTLLQRQSPRDFLLQHTLMVNVGDRYSLEKLRLQLDNSGYRHVDQVFGPGEYASRGSILDLFPMGSGAPYRIDFFDDEIDTIRTFDPENQRSIEAINRSACCLLTSFPPPKRPSKNFAFAGAASLKRAVNPNRFTCK